ncbi:hypothetical protein BDZ94DRAFT_1258941 [Collybia nuda]|uniref:Uncharacterized protein n=1 Tax=Collybia nuda TaxID=64659 RepID=A0A9P5Y6C0_9AGAR|nr:hypothetical protein BDZ94DRAFT_1258941 [Collybia nuda]
MGGLALVLMAMLLLYIYFDRKKKRRELRKASAADFPVQYSSVLQREQLRDPRTFSLHKRVPSRPHSPADVSGNPAVKAPHSTSSSNTTDMAQHIFTKGRSNFGNIDIGTAEVESSTGTTNTSAILSNSDLRARQLDLERRLQDAQRGLRAIGIDSQGDPANANSPLAMAHTRQHAQGGVEEPPPEYSAR